jgi:hypothetical protein
MKILRVPLPKRIKYLNSFCYEINLNFIKLSAFFKSKNSKSLNNLTSNPFAIKLLSFGQLLWTYAIFLYSVQPRLYIYRSWRELLTVDNQFKLITDETGHYLNTNINYLSDTRCVEGEIYSNLVWSIASNRLKIDRLPRGNDKVNLIF